MSDNLYLFANNNNGQAENNGSYRLYDMKIEGDSEGVESGVDYVDYLEGDGASYIDTKTVLQNGYSVEVDYIIKSDALNNTIMIYGAGSPTGYAYDNQGGYGLGVEKTYSYIQTRDAGSGIFVDSYTKTKITQNTKNNFKYTFTNISSQRNPYLFANNYGNTADNISCKGLLIYSFKAYDTSDNLVLDLRPCLNTEGVPCMYDEVSKRYLYNQGTGTFRYKKKLRDFQPVLDSNNVPCLLDKIKNKFYYSKSGEVFKTKEKPKYKKLKYIQGNGSFNIDTNISLNPQSKIEHTFQEMESSLNISYLKVGDGSKFKFYSEDTISNYAMTYNGVYVYCRLIDILRNKSILLIDKNKIYVNGELKSQGNETTSTINYNGFLSIKGNASTRLYSSKVWNENNELVLDLIPVLDQDNVPCMYDKVTDTFFYNQGTGEFSYGIEELDAPPVDYVEYLEGDGASYIDISNMTYFEDINIEIKASKRYGDAFLYGTNGEYNTYRTELMVANAAISTMLFATGGTIYTCSNENEPKVYKTNSSGFYIDDVKANVDWTISTSNYQNAPKTFRIFGRYGYKEKISMNGTRIYYLKIFDGDVLKYDFRPCLDSEGIPCMYDTVSKQYFYNQGTGEFLHGDRIGYTPIEYIESTGTQYIDTEVVPTSNTDIEMTCRVCDYNETPTLTNSYIMNGLQINNNTYQYNSIDTTVQPNLIASTGATLTMGSTNLALLDEDDIETATNNGWSLV